MSIKKETKKEFQKKEEILTDKKDQKRFSYKKDILTDDRK